MSGVSFEYGLIGFLSLFTALTFVTFGLIGVSQIDADFNEQPNLIEGVSYFFQNPFTSGWEKIIYTMLIITPLGAIITMIGLNYARGRG